MSAIAQPVHAKVDLHSPETAKAGLRVFFNIAAEWKLSIAQQLALLGVSRATLYQWRNASEKGKVGALDRNTLERLSYIFGIYKALQILFPTEQRATSWLRAPNAAPLFNGQTALDRMTRGQVGDLYVVRQYLDAVRGGKS